jgi:hypothetical protein
VARGHEPSSSFVLISTIEFETPIHDFLFSLPTRQRSNLS